MPKKKQQNASLEPFKDGTYEDFLVWFALPTTERQKAKGYNTVTEYSQYNDIDRTTLWRWRKSPEFRKRVNTIRKDWGDDMTAQVFDGWKMACMKGNPKAIELWLSYFHGFDKKNVHEVQTQQHVEPNDIRALIEELPEDEQEHYYITLAQLAARVRELRTARGYTDAESQPAPDVQEQTYQLPQGAPDTRVNEMATGHQEYLRTAVEW